MIKLMRLDKTHYRIFEEDMWFRQGMTLYRQVGIDEVFIEDLLFKVWQELHLDEDSIDIALDDLWLYGHDVALFKSDGHYCYTLSKEEWEKSI